MKTCLGLLSTMVCCGAVMANDAVRELSKHLGRTPALVVVVCAGNERELPTIIGLVEQTPWTILCRGTPTPALDRLRVWAREKGILGARLYVVDEPGGSLGLAGDLADAVWVAPDVARPPSEKEILRTLHPGGVYVASGKVVVKPAPPGVAEWRHPYHEPDNNVVSQDRVARLPGELRFQTYPVYAAMPNQTLFAGGRIFFFTGHIAFHEREESLLNTLTVLNAYNGLRLWSRPLDRKYVVHNVAKLATGREIVFAEGGNLWMLDAATGQERGRYSIPPEAAAAGDTDWKWLALQKDTLLVALGPPDASVAPHRQKMVVGGWPWNVANDQYKSIIDNFGAARRLAAFRYPEMKLLWIVSEPEAFDVRALCLEGGRIFELAPEKYMAARDSATGNELWRRTPSTSKDLFDAIGGALKRHGWGLGWATYCCARASRGVVCIAGPPFKKTIGVSLERGELLWSLGIESPHPFFFQDALYVVPRVGRTTACQIIDPTSGKVLDQYSLGVTGSCTRLTVTPNQFYYRPGGGIGKTVYADIGARKLAEYEGIVRPGCFDGVVPANGRLYWMPLACGCWQVHGTFCMAPRRPLNEPSAPAESSAWASPAATTPAAANDWPMFRANSAGTARVPAAIPQKVRELWRRQLPGSVLTAPICATGRIFVGGTDGTVRALDADNGKVLWQAASQAAVLHPPAYWQGRVVFGSCDGSLYCVDASDGKVLGRAELAPEKRLVNIMDRLMSAWPLGGGVVVSDDGLAYTAAGSTATDGAVAAATDITSGRCRWRQSYTLDRREPKLSFGVQSNVLLKDNTLYINGGAPVGIVALDAASGANPRVVSQRQSGMEMFLRSDGQALCAGPELFCHDQAKTLDLKNSGQFPSVVRLLLGHDLPGARNATDFWGVAIGSDGLVVLHQDRVEGISQDGRSLWTVPLPVPPVRWGVALTGKQCAVTLSNGLVMCLGEGLHREP
jgi:outer membrane protein assembly factor BamB